MSYLFDHLDEVGDILSASPFGLVTDVDGTISPIAPTPQQAIVSPMCRRYLSMLSDKLDLVAVISGRPLLDVMTMVGIEGLVYVGNHGLEVWNKGIPELPARIDRFITVIAQALESLERRIDMDGLMFENKGLTASIHYRNANDTDAARKKILEEGKSLPQINDLRITEGRMVVELRPDIDINKGSALKALIKKHNLAGVMYIGDDVTDIDAFNVVHESGIKGIAIAVASEETPPRLIESADFTIQGVTDVERLLEWLAQSAGR
ncbi:MAG: trehalose-phosphatase [Chloroflexi bacterium]|jgi:trehalose 6-phosphate phosphatase|nr:trehalose-phosphatase [Chloroflexota bacterium]MBT7081626.1 trehalose-phosphatase [Chloroflexota bacterium]MBT7288956.1 trehalose-phosphatase [Chloroflexota bacterium]